MAEENSIAHLYNLGIIGGSAGSLEVILKLIPNLRSDLPFALVIIVHRRAAQDSVLVDLMASRASLPVKEVEEKEQILPGHIYIAPADYHLLVEKDHTFSLDYSEKINYSRPSIDVSFDSASEVYGPALFSILLSGANADGVAGMRKVKENGGLVVVQEPGSAEVEYMPRQAISQVKVHHVVYAEQLASFINQL